MPERPKGPESEIPIIKGIKNDQKPPTYDTGRGYTRLDYADYVARVVSEARKKSGTWSGPITKEEMSQAELEHPRGTDGWINYKLGASIIAEETQKLIAEGKLKSEDEWALEQTIATIGPPGKFAWKEVQDWLNPDAYAGTWLIYDSENEKVRITLTSDTHLLEDEPKRVREDYNRMLPQVRAVAAKAREEGWEVEFIDAVGLEKDSHK